MNSSTHPTEPNKPNPFWVLLAILALIGVDHTLRLGIMLKRRGQLNQAQAIQVENSSRVVLAQQFTERFQPLMLELIQIAATNASAKAIVDEFQIQYFPPSPATNPPSPATEAPTGR